MPSVEIAPRALRQHYRTIRARLFSPNAKPDTGIDLRRQPLVVNATAGRDVANDVAGDSEIIERPAIRNSHSLAPVVPLADEQPIVPRYPKVRDIQKIVAAFYDVTVLDLLSARKPVSIVRPRQIAMYLCRHATPLSFPQIGRFFGGRDHTTAIFAVARVTKLRAADPKMDADIRQLEEKIAAALAPD